MKNLFIIAFCFISLSVFAQAELNKKLQLTGAGADAKIEGIKEVTGAQDAVSAEVHQKGGLVYSADIGAANAYAVTLAPAVTAYTTGMIINFKAANANIGASTLNANGLGAVSIKKEVTEDLVADDIKAGQMVSVIYDGTDFQMLSQLGNASSGGNWTLSGTDIYNSNAGNVGIGITSPVVKLDVVGEIMSRDDLEPAVRVYKTGGTAAITYLRIAGITTANNFQVYHGGSNRLDVTTGGDVGIGTTTPGARLEVAGQIKITGGTPAAGEVLTSDGTGLATWEPVAGGGPDPCPAGFSVVTNKYCIETAEHSTSINWHNAVTNCASKDARLCTPGEWYYACNNAGALGLTGMGSGIEWFDEAGQNNGSERGASGGGCTSSYNSVSWSNSYQGRCCYNR